MNASLPPHSMNIQSSNSFNSNTFSSGLKSRSKKHSEDYSLKSDQKFTTNDIRDLQTYPKRFLPPENGTNHSLSKVEKESSSNNTNRQFSISQKNLTKKILERIESEQNHLNVNDEDKSAEFQEVSEMHSLTQMEEDILNTISNKHTTSNGHDPNEDRRSNADNDTDSFKMDTKSDKVLKKNVTFSNRISRAKTYDIKLDENLSNSKSRSAKSPKSNHEGTFNDLNMSDEKKKRGPERIYDVLKQKKGYEKGSDKICKNIAVMMLVNHFVRQIKLKSGHFGVLGNRQLKILNDLCTQQKPGSEKKDDLEHANILVRLIKQNQLIQKTLKKSNFFKKWTEFLLEKFQKKILSRIKVLMPNHKFKFTLNCFVLVFSIIEFGYIPLNSTFDISGDTFYPQVRSIFIIILLIDILLNFNTGYFQRGTLILNRREILKRYFRLDFWVESLTILPLIILNILANESLERFRPQINFFEFVFLLRIIYLDKMIRKICDFYQSTEFLNNFISLLKLGVWSLYVAHLCACMFHYVSETDLSQYHQTWISNFLMVSEDTSLYSEYITSLYWSVTTMVTVGYGDVIPVTPHERIVAITSMLGACCVFAYIMNSIGGIINSFNNRQTVLRQKIQAVNKYLDMKNIDNDLRIRIRKYLEYLYEEKNAMMKEGHSVVFNLSTSLKTEIFQRLNGEIIVNIPILINNFSLKLLSSLTLFMNEVSFTPEDFIFDENNVDEQELFYIYEGEVELYIQNTTGFREDTHLKKLQKGEYFGELSFFTGNPRSASAESLDFSSLISIKRSDFITVIKNSSYDYEKLCMLRDNVNLYQNYSQLNVRCFCCNYTNHIAKDCPMVHVIVNPQRVIRDHIKIEPTIRRQFPRFQKKFKALKNLGAMIIACIKLHRTTTLEMSTVVDPDDEDNEDDEEEVSSSPLRPFSPIKRFGSQNTAQSYTLLRSKSNNKSAIQQEELSMSDEKEKIFRGDRKARKERSGAMTTMNYGGGSMTTGFSGAFETYINNMNAVIENERNSPIMSLKKKKTLHLNMPTQTTIPNPRTPRYEDSLSPRKKKTQIIEGEKGNKYTEHQKMVAEALMLQGINNNPQENYTKLTYNELMNQFDKMKSFEIYFPHNNVEVIVEVIKNIQKNMASKRRKSRFKKRNSSISPQDYQQHGFSSFYQMSFKQIFKGETLHTHNSNYEDLMYRRALTQNEGSPAKKLRLLPTKSLNYSRGITTLKQNLHKCQTLKKKITKSKFLWMCFACKKKKFGFKS